MGKLYGGILIYEIWKTTRFSNLEILAKMEKEMASQLEKEQGFPEDRRESHVSNISANSEAMVADMIRVDQNAEEREDYDQYDEDPNFCNRQRDYYNQR